MKTKIALGVAGLWAAMVGSAFGDKSREGTAATDARQPMKSGPEMAASTPAPAISFDEAQRLVVASRKYVAHPKSSQSPDAESSSTTEVSAFRMAAPPPPARSETQPASPAPGLVWVAGHYMPVKGEWRWVTGEWAMPATPVSVWIAATYDEKKQEWTPGYWQPDRPPAAEDDSKDSKSNGIGY